MDNSLQILRPDSGSHTAEDGPSLLIELEPARRAFFGNLAELFRPTPPAAYSKPGRFWGDVFVQTSLPWWRLFESMLWHALMIAAFVSLSKYWKPHDHLIQQLISHSQVTYYKPSTTFPALGNSGPSMAPRPKEAEHSSAPSALRVARQQDKKLSAPPQLTDDQSHTASLANPDRLLPAIPLSATSRSQLTAQPGPNSIVAPPPDVNLGAASRIALPQPSGIGPAPNIVTSSPERRTVSAPGLAGVAPPSPSMPASVRNLGDINIAPSEAVAPSPNLPMHEQQTGAGSHRGLGNSGGSAVPPTPALASSGVLGTGRRGSLSGGSSGAVPPAPSSGEASAGLDNGARGIGGRSLPLASGNSQVVPPAPSIENGSGSGQLAGGRANTLSGGNSDIVPPSPSIAGAARAGNTGSGSLANAGLEAVPPTPSVSDGSNSSSSRGSGDTLNSAAQVVPPAPSNPAAGTTSGSDRPIEAAEPPSAASQNTPAKNQRRSPPEELALRIVGLVLALPNSSYFANYEVFIAERKVGKENPEFIKLVYEYLPYQRALSQYEQNNSKIFKLRVTRDSSCDESLMQMTWPENDPHPQSPSDSPGLSAGDRNGMLPCYRTTADDYRKAVSRKR